MKFWFGNKTETKKEEAQPTPEPMAPVTPEPQPDTMPEQKPIASPEPPPVITHTGLPCKSGSSFRSQETKKQSQSTNAITCWRILPL